MATHRLRPDLNTGTIQQAVIDAVNANYHAGDSLFSCGTVQYLLDTIKEKDEVIRQLSSGDYFVHY